MADGQLPNYALSPNPQLPVHPLGRFTDSLYEAAHAQLAQEIQQRYADVIQQLGYEDPTTHQFIKGLVEINADRQRGQYGDQLTDVRRGVDQQSQRDQNFFSGYHADQIAQGEHPIIQALANLDVDTPQQLSGLYEQAGGLMNEFNTRNNVLLAEAAGRYDPSSVGGGGGGDPTPPVDDNPYDNGPNDAGKFTGTGTGYAPGGVNYKPLAPGDRAAPFPKLTPIHQFVGPKSGYAPGGVNYKPLPVIKPKTFRGSTTGYAGGGVNYRGYL